MGYKDLPFVAAGTAVAVGMISAGVASASGIVARNAQDVRLRVSPDGKRALALYRAQGRDQRVLAWGATNALPPTSGRRQVKFRFDFSGGRGAAGAFRNSCRPYDGPALQWLVTACKAPDGSYWALQQWQRLLPGLGRRPGAKLGAWELHLSHWTGPIA